jgi:hypothetical protein
VSRTLSSFCWIALIPLLLSSAGPAAAQGAPEFPPIAEVTKGYEVKRGFITLYINARKQHLLGEIPRSLIERPFLLATSIAGGFYTGWQWDDKMVKWERLDRRLLLVEPEIRYKAPGGTLRDVVKRTYRDSVLTSVPIVAEGPAGSCLIDLTALFAGRASLFVGSLAAGVDASLTKIIQAKAFEKNVEIELDFMRQGGGRAGGGFSLMGRGSSGGLGVHYSISELPSTGYRPRLADDRIGYFLTAHKDFSKSPREETRFVRFINRWHLEKLDPTLALSPPKERIVFYIEKTVPIRYRRYVEEGILEWNKAFERVGFDKAIEVRQQTDTQFSDLDPEDVRYNFFRWITSESSFAMGPSRVHPETGQILDADIIFDDAMIRDWLDEYARLIEKGPAEEFHPALKRYLSENPHRHPLRRWLPPERFVPQLADLVPQPAPIPADPGSLPFLPGGAPLDHLRSALGSPFSGEPPGGGDLLPPAEPPVPNFNHSFCDFGHGVRHQVNFGTIAMTLLSELAMQPDMAQKPKDEWPEEFVGQIVKEVVMHEVGHTLGLRHNFKGSSWLSLEEINDAKNPPQALSGSVMDYNPTNISPAGKPQGFWNTRTLGPYDYWAIEYGYALKDDPKELAAIASRVAESGLAYGTDEDTWSSDPLINRFDMGKDPLEFARHRMALVRQMLANLLERAVKPGQGYQRARQAFNLLLYEKARSSWFATKFVGGHSIHRDHKGDPNERPPVVPIPAAKQREALDLVCENVFSRDAFRYPPQLFNYLAVGRWMHWGSSDMNQDPEFPIHDRILQLQLWTLFDFMNPRTLMLIADAEMRVAADADAITIPELFGKLTDEIWSELKTAPAGSFTNRKPLITSLRRNLQHEYTGELINLALEGDRGMSPQSARTQAWFQLQKLRERIDNAVKPLEGSSLDDYSLAHLLETRQRIDKALEASYSRNGGGGGVLFLFGRQQR